MLAIVRPGWGIVSVEATGKKAAFQKKIVKALRLKNVKVISARGEELAQDKKYRGQFDVCTFRAVANLSMLLELGAGFIKTGGTLLAWKGPKAIEEIEAAKDAYKKLHIELNQLWKYQIEDGDVLLVDQTKMQTTPNQYPRQWGIMKNKPL